MGRDCIQSATVGDIQMLKQRRIFAKLLEKYCSLKLWEFAFFTANAMKYNGMLIFPFWLIRNYREINEVKKGKSMY